MSKNILFSIIITTYKRSDKILRAIDSILNQKFSNCEIIVVDDNDENSVYRKENEKKLNSYVKNNKIIYLKHKKNKNGAAARNTGIRKALGEYIMFLDDDDEFYNYRLNKASNYIIKYNKPDFIYTGFIIKHNGITRKRKKCLKNNDIKFLIYNLLCQKSFIGTGSNMICKRSIINEINGFDEKFIRHQDIEFLIRYLTKSTSIKTINEYLVIKNNDDNRNLPNVYSLYETKKLFLDKFKNIINKYSNRKAKKIIKYNYYELLKVAYIKNDREQIKEAIKLLKVNKIYNIFIVKKIEFKQKIKNLIIKI